VDGLKTGFTDGAGFCLSATAERAGRRIIVVMMDSPDSRTRDLNVQQLISEAFAALPLGEKPFAPSPTGPVQPTRPAPPILTPDGAPVVRYPGAGGS
jgi:D-alanyl-D-alanine carboxypeptidase (penicillin-binding protein 5/6)